MRAVLVGTGDGVFTDWTDAFTSLLRRHTDDYSFSTLGGAVLMPGETMHAVSVDRGPLADSLSLATADLRVDICYCSAYEDCWWLTDAHLGAPRSHQQLRPVEACHLPEPDRFLM